MSYIPPHKRLQQINELKSAKADGPKPVNGSRTKKTNRKQINVKDPAQSVRTPASSNRFKDMFSSYESPSSSRGGYKNGGSYGNNKWGNKRGFDSNGRGGRSYGGYQGGYNNLRGRAQMELSLRPVPQLERELFGDQAEAMSAGIDFDKYNDIPVEMSGEDLPEAIADFKSADIAPKLLANIERSGFLVPTPVQKFSLPVVMQKRDLMACAQTGSGKTAAFLFPVIHNLLTQPSVANGRSNKFSCYYPRSLVISPTRELSQQIYKQSRKFLYCTGMRSVCIYGGSSIKDQFKELEGGVHILVATPGRLYDMIERGRVSLCQCEYLTLDEADRMLDMGFEPQIRQIVEQSDLISSEDGRNTLMFSATFPVDIQQLAMDFLNDYIFLAVGRVGSTTDLIEQQVRQVDERDKFDELLEIMEKIEGQLKLVFTATKRGADRVEYDLRRKGYQALSIHGDKTQREREYALQSFRKKRIDTLVATDVAARGLDIPNVKFVIQYDLPSSIDDYVHRIGRTGRCGNKGIAIAFVNHTNNNVMKPLFELLEENEQEIPDWFRQMVSYLYKGSKKKNRNGRYGGRDARKGNRGSSNYGNARKGSRYSNNSFNKNRNWNSSGRQGGQQW